MSFAMYCIALIFGCFPIWWLPAIFSNLYITRWGGGGGSRGTATAVVSMSPPAACCKQSLNSGDFAIRPMMKRILIIVLFLIISYSNLLFCSIFWRIYDIFIVHMVLPSQIFFTELYIIWYSLIWLFFISVLNQQRTVQAKLLCLTYCVNIYSKKLINP